MMLCSSMVIIASAAVSAMMREIFGKSVAGAAGLLELELSMGVFKKLILFSSGSQFTALVHGFGLGHLAAIRVFTLKFLSEFRLRRELRKASLTIRKLKLDNPGLDVSGRQSLRSDSAWPARSNLERAARSAGYGRSAGAASASALWR